MVVIATAHPPADHDLLASPAVRPTSVSLVRPNTTSDAMTALSRAAQACRVPTAAVVVATPDGDEVIAAAGADDLQAADLVAVCALGTLRAEPVIIPDAAKDAGLGDIPVVAHGTMRFLARFPLLMEDAAVAGALVLLDRRPRRLTSSQVDEVAYLARSVARTLELERAAERLRTLERALVGRRAMHDGIIAAALDCIVTIDAAGLVVDFNPAAERTFGYSRDEATGRDMAELIIPPRLRERHRSGMQRLLSTSKPQILNRRVELEAMRRNGSEFPVELTVTQLSADPPLFAGHLRDISDRKAAEADQLRLVAVVDSSQDAVIGLDRDGVIFDWNRGAAQLYGFERSEMVGCHLQRIVPPQHADAFSRALTSVLTGEEFARFETQRRAKDGRLLDVSVTLSPIIDSSGALIGVSSIARDISERKRLEEALRHEADHDPLTGLVNRRVLKNRLEELIGRPAGEACGAVIIVDLDNFKLVNDSLGHHGGDELIRLTAETLRATVEMPDTVARFGGDDFAVLVPYCGEARAQRIAQEILDRVAAQDSPVTFGASAGIATLTPGASADDVLVAADMALYEAKAGGPGCAVVYRGDEPKVLRTLARVKDAIAGERLRLYAQPILDLATNAIVQHELLIRMIDDDGNVVSPGTFIPIAERFGLIAEIDRWVVGQAVEIARHGRRVAVNLSARSLGEPTLTTFIHEQIRAGLTGENLSFEITETAALANLTTAREFASALTSLGCGFALDDFGTGFGSLVHLKHLPVNTVKIDMQFVRNITRDATDRCIVEGIVAVAHNLGHTTIAEGVEDERTLDLVRELGVSHAQGFYIGRPAPALSGDDA